MKKTPISITPARLSDLSSLNELMYQLHDEHHKALPDTIKTADQIQQEKSIARYLDEPDCLVFVARVKGEVVGLVTGQFCELISPISQPLMMGSIDELYILPEYRRLDIGSMLITTLEEVFSDYGVKEVFVEVWEFNQSALTFYYERGFERHIHWLRRSLTDPSV
ncbi:MULTISPECIES: GNAT family N-acetyltransferase [unclassified Vibrio]|uniref:GNAT family N-acetyltransferase n=1 Tax=Vibrio sp. HB236076 TaxID=3232307 RepID=A0AB39HHQ6_9VIBR|nr:GNAT family N-acetyltransferase [Vibrio sp. HB161653]MDP5254946.1 GNAT family N-acetyltransferase [Vibrio sp. HB161653]